MSREALGHVMASIGITRYTSTTVDDALVRFDETGHVFTSAYDGVHCINPAGELIGKIKVPEVVANVAWGNGDKRNRLYILTLDESLSADPEPLRLIAREAGA